MQKRSIYKKLVRSKKHSFKLKQSKEFENLRKKQPRDFWNFFKRKTCKMYADIDISDFYRHFSEIFDNIKKVNIPEVEDFISNHDFNDDDSAFEELNLPITQQEVLSAIKRLSKNKSVSPSDNLLNEYLIESSDILSGHLTDMFNIIFNSGHFPTSWSKGYIVPIFKKGDKNDTNNYRGITLTSNLGKLFTSILNLRVEKWFESNNLLSDSQFGFRKQCSTADAIFILSNLVQYILNQNLRLPCAFIDLKKAFDSVNTDALWYKLFHMGMNGKLLKLFRSMYASVKSCIKYSNRCSEFFLYFNRIKTGTDQLPSSFCALFGRS